VSSLLSFFFSNQGADRDTRRPQREHTEIEEELHELAHIDYDRVAIVRLQTTRHSKMAELT